MSTHRSYIEAANICSPFLRYAWDEWNVGSTYQSVNAGDVVRLRTISKRANCAFTIAIAEWILARYKGMDNDPEPEQFLEAAWAANIHKEYAWEIEIIDAEWTGPIRGPISMALTFVLDAIFADDADLNSAFNPAWAACFARHILPDVSVFNIWFEFSLTRIEQLYPAPLEKDLDWFDETENLGKPVPIEVFDQNNVFNPATTSQLLDRFLLNLNPEMNPFLRSVEDMKADGFKGEPYRYINEQ